MIKNESLNMSVTENPEVSLLYFRSVCCVQYMFSLFNSMCGIMLIIINCLTHLLQQLWLLGQYM